MQHVLRVILRPDIEVINARPVADKSTVVNNLAGPRN